MEVINLSDMKKVDENTEWDDICDELKNETFRGAFIARKTSGDYIFGCTDDNKAAQYRYLYKLNKVIEYYIENSFDMVEVEETSKLLGVPVQDLLEDSDNVTSI